MKITAIHNYRNQTEFCTENQNGKEICFMSASFYPDSWVASISSQRGCPLSCTFCDIPFFGFYGNATTQELKNQTEMILNNFNSIEFVNAFYLHFARMGEPTFNPAVLDFTANSLKPLINSHLLTNTIHPTLLTMLPKNNPKLEQFLQDWTVITNEIYNGEAGLQFSINSTDNQQRNEMFNNKSLSLEQISQLTKQLPIPTKNKYILNFAITKDSIIDPDILDQLFDKAKFIIKITPIHETESTLINNFNLSDNETNYTICKQIETQLLKHNWEVTTFIPLKQN